MYLGDAPGVALRLLEDVLRAEGELLGLDDPYDVVVEPEGVVGRPVSGLFLLGPKRPVKGPRPLGRQTPPRGIQPGVDALLPRLPFALWMLSR